MADETRDLTLNLQTQAEQTKAELKEVASLETTIGVNAEQASRVAEAAIDRHAALLSELRGANNAAANAVTDMAAAGDVGGKKYAESITVARDAVARLELAVAAVKAQGGPVTTSQIAELAVFDAAVQAATISLEKQGAATRGVNAEVGLARGNLGGMANAMKGLGGAVGDTLLGFLVFEGLFKILPTLIKSVEDAGTGLGNAYSKLAGNVDEEAKALTENDKATAKADQSLKALLDTKALQIRIQDAVNAGLMTDTGNAQLNAAVYELLRARLTGMVEVTDDYVKKAKELGIAVPESFTRVRATAEGLQEGYSRAMKVSIADGQAFAEANEKLLNTVIVRFQDAGEKVPPELLKIKKLLDDTHGSVEELTKSIDKHKEKITELNAKLAEHAKQLAENAAEIEKHRKTQEAASDAEYKAVRHNLDQQLVDLEANRRAGLVTEEHYRSEVARIQNDQHEARRAWEIEVAKIDADAAKRIEDAQKKDDAKTAKIKANREEEITAETKLDLERERVRQRDAARAVERQVADDAALVRLGQFNDRAKLLADFREVEARNVISGFEDIGLAIDTALTKLIAFGNKLKEISVSTVVGEAPTGGGGAGGF